MVSVLLVILLHIGCWLESSSLMQSQKILRIPVTYYHWWHHTKHGRGWPDRHHIARFRQSFRQGPPWQAIASNGILRSTTEYPWMDQVIPDQQNSVRNTWEPQVRSTWRCLRSSSMYRDGSVIVPGIHKWLTWSNILKCQTFCRWLSTIPPHQKDSRCRFRVMSSMVISNWDLQDLLTLNPCCSSQRTWWWSKWSMMELWTMCSNSLQAIEVSDTDR
jgi:hypothetical protein